MSGLPLNGVVEGTFVFETIRDRWPKILAKIVDHIHRQRPLFVSQFGNEGDEDVKFVNQRLSELRYRVATDKPLLKFNDELRDVGVWNAKVLELQQKLGEDNTSWYRCDWLFVECYLYRKVAEFFSLTKHLQDFDYFALQKQTSFTECLVPISKIVNHCLRSTSTLAAVDAEEIRVVLRELIEISLWGNKCDLSLSGGDSHEPDESPIERVKHLRKNILADDIDRVVQHLLNLRGSGGEVHIVADNASIELVGDMALAEFLLTKKIASKVVFHVKAMPWFVSDVTVSDFSWTMEKMLRSNEDSLNKFAEKLESKLNSKALVLQAHPFWTYGFTYMQMPEYAADLYAELKNADLTIFKGDLNYRKLIRDCDWPYNQSLSFAIGGFLPSPMLALRTLKAETVAGLPDDTVTFIREKYGKSKKWMITGEYAVAQFIEI